MSTEALRLALEALENITSVSICEATHHPKKDRHLLCEECPNEVRHLKAITAIKAALEAKDEPVAWEHLKPYGYAPGGYMMTCHGCNTTVVDVDKRASQCRTCTEAMYAKKNQQANEPVGFMHAGQVLEMQQGRLPCGYVYPKRKPGASVALYRTPPQRKPLTYVELRRIANDCGLGANNVSARTQVTVDSFARAIEAAHGIKEAS